MIEIQDDRTTRTNIVTIDTAGNISTTATPSASTHLVTKALLDGHNHAAAYAAVEHDSAHDDRFSLLAHGHTAPTWTEVSGKPTTFAPTEHDADHSDAFSATGHTHTAHADSDHDDRFALIEHDTAHDDRFALRTVSISTTAPLSGGGDLTATRTLSIAADGVTNTLLAQMPATTIKGNNTAGSTGPLDLTVAQTRSMVASGAGAFFGFDFDTTTSAGPAVTRLRLNNATPASATIVYVSYTSKDGVDLKTRLLAGTAGDRLFIQDRANSANFRLYELTGTPTDGTTYATCNVVHRTGGGTLANSAEIVAGFTPSPFTVGTTAPSAPLTGDIWIDTT